MYFIPGELLPRVMKDPKIMLAPVLSRVNWWLEFPGFQDPKSPFHDKRVREAISLAIDRKAMNRRRKRRAGQGQTATGSTTTSSTALDWPEFGRTTSPRPRS